MVVQKDKRKENISDLSSIIYNLLPWIPILLGQRSDGSTNLNIKAKKKRKYKVI